MNKSQDKKKAQDKKRAKKQNYFKNQQKLTNAKKEPKVVQETENNIFQFTEEEKEHLDYLDKTYRDRAKERREAEAQNLDEEFLNEESNVFEEDVKRAGFKKGLDFDLFERERQKAEVEEEIKEALSDTEPKEKVQESNETLKRLPKTIIGLAIHNILKNDSSNEVQRRKVPIEDVHYDYDLNQFFGSDVPKVIIRSSKNAKEKDPYIDAEIDDEIINQLKKVMAYVKSKPQRRVEHKIEEVKSVIQTNDKLQQNSVKNNANLISIPNEAIDEEDDIFQDVKPSSVPNKPEKPNNENSKKIFDDLKKTFQTQKIKEDEIERNTQDKSLSNNGLGLLQDFSLPAIPSNKRPREEDDGGYGECFPEVELPSLEELKNYREKHGISIKEAALQSFADKKHYEQKKNKNKKKQLEKDAVKIKQMMQDQNDNIS